jgi:hypothetical protein
VKHVWRLGIPVIMTVCGAAVSAAQSSFAQPEIPAAYAPPAGMCRVWLRDVPPVQQPAPTDCRSALRTKPVGATVIYGPESKRSGLSPTDWTRPSLRPSRDDDRSRTRFRQGDDAAPAGDSCTDGGHDARCDDSMATMPSMRAAVLWTEGQRPAELQRWFGTANVAARFTMPARGGSPDRVQWFDVDGRLVQIWTDRNGDGRADRVEIFNRDGARIRVVGQ